MDSDTVRVAGSGEAPAMESEVPTVDSAEPDGSGGREGLVNPAGVIGRSGSQGAGHCLCWKSVWREPCWRQGDGADAPCAKRGMNLEGSLAVCTD